MNRISFFLLGFSLLLFPLAAKAESFIPIESPRLNVERLGGKVTVRFSAATGVRYQLFRSADLGAWEPVGNVIEGRDATVTVEQTVDTGQSVFFRVEARKVVLPVPLAFSTPANSRLSLIFPSSVGQTYLAYSSDDLKDWFVMGDLIQGTGATITIDTPSFNNSKAFFAVESLDLTPLPNMVRIKSGRFRMGSPPEEKDRDLDEDPLTEVVFPTSFWMGKYEVTQSAYERVMGVNPSWFKGDSDRPVEQVSWQDALFFCAILTETERAAGRLTPSFAYRLPTEAEFEYVCRAGTTTRFSHGEDIDFQQLGEYAWFDGNSGNMSHRVGEKLPNPFGLYDMHGNVWEWCLDLYGSGYAGGTITAPSGPATGTARVFRGGGWDYVAASCRSAYRNNVNPTRRLNYVGFRLVLAPNVLVPGL